LTRICGRIRALKGSIPVLAAIAIVLTAACPAPAPPDVPVSAVVIPAFAVTGTLEQPDFVGAAVAASLARNLEAVPGLRVLDVEPAEAPDVAVLHGEFRRDETETCLAVQANRTGRAEPAWSVRRCSSTSSIPDLVVELSRGCVEELGRELPRRYGYIGRVAGGPEMAQSQELATARDEQRRGNLPALVAAGRALVERFPAEPDAHVILAMGLSLSWDASPSAAGLAELKEALDSLARVDPNSPYVDVLRAFVYRTSGAPDEARQLYSQVLDRDDLTPSARAWVLRQRSFALSQAGQKEAARRDADAAAHLDPADPVALGALSRALEDVGELDTSLTRAREALVLEPASWRNLQRVGIAAMRAGEGEQAVDYLRAACERGANQEVCANYAVALHHAGRSEEELREARAAKAQTASPWGAYNLACLWALRGERDAALAALREAYDLGFTDVLITTDSDLDSLRTDPRFKAEVEKVLGRIRARREMATTVFPWQG